MSERVAQGQLTRRQLVDAATRVFAERGYDAASVEAVLAATGVSRGALYHHFKGKDALFAAVLEATEERIAAAIVGAARAAATPREALRAGAHAWLRLAEDPAAQQIALIDAPAVVGWERWREIDARHGFGLLKGALQAIASEGGLRPELVDSFAHMLLAALLELALLIARSADRETALRSAGEAVDQLLERLVGRDAPSPRKTPQPSSPAQAPSTGVPAAQAPQAREPADHAAPRRAPVKSERRTRQR
jgi:AcrR family transcriptional regulator